MPGKGLGIGCLLPDSRTTAADAPPGPPRAGEPFLAYLAPVGCPLHFRRPRTAWGVDYSTAGRGQPAPVSLNPPGAGGPERPGRRNPFAIPARRYYPGEKAGQVGRNRQPPGRCRAGGRGDDPRSGGTTDDALLPGP